MSDERMTYDQIETEYLASDGGLFDESDPRLGPCRAALRNLPEEERRLFITYCEMRSARKLGDMLGVSKSTARNRITEIRRKILKATQ